jgi:uncharacterized protein (TIGR02118 family)
MRPRYRYYFETHVPIAKKISGVTSYVVNSGSPTMMTGGLAPHLIAELEFDSMESLQTAMASPERQAAAADLANFAQAGVTLLVFDTRTL